MINIETANDIVEQKENFYECKKTNLTVRIVVATPKTEEEFQKTKEFSQLFKLCSGELHFTGKRFVPRIKLNVFTENSQGLSKIYNQFINDEHKNEIVVFLHDDVIIDDSRFYQKLIQAHEEYDIVGLAGAHSINEFKRESPSLWHLMSSKTAQSGFVTHTNDNLFWTTNFGKSPQSTEILDGLFLSVNINTALENNLKFDEDFSFHHYDLSFCCRANELNMSLGTVPIFVIHGSIGASGLTDEWKESHFHFIKKYKKC